MNKSGGKLFLLAISAVLAAGCQQENQANQSGGTTEAGGAQKQAQGGSVGQTIGASADHSRFAAAIKAAGLDATLAGSQPYTVFAPNNAAFDKLPAGAADGMMQPAQKGQLVSVVTGHIVPGVVTADDLSRAVEKGGGKAQIATVGGGALTATKSGDAIMLSGGNGAGARVTPGTQPQANGVVHTLDSILMPR